MGFERQFAGQLDRDERSGCVGGLIGHGRRLDWLGCIIDLKKLLEIGLGRHEREVA
jgi:hypothetical protein